MKRFSVLAFLACICIIANAQVDVNGIKENTTSVSQVYQGSNPIKQKQVNAKQWIATTFGDYKSVLQFEDDENGKIIIKGKAPLTTETGSILVYDYTLSFTLTIDNKEDRFRIKMEDLKVEQYSHFSHSTQDLSVVKYNTMAGTNYDDDIEWRQNRLDAIHATDKTKLKKKELKALEEEEAKLQEDLEKAIKEKEEAEEKRAVRYATFKRTIQNTFKSLSEAVNYSDDF